MNAREFADHIKGKLIVSCQALEYEPLHGSHMMAKMARAAKMGGAVAIRANTPSDIRAIRAEVDLPIIGLYKDGENGVYITPTFDHARAIADAGADVIALDCTNRKRPDGSTVPELLARIRDELKKPILADISTFEEAQSAVEYGADFVAPTLSGYTEYSPILDCPDFDLLTQMVAKLTVPVIAEGKIHTPQLARQALDIGAWAVVVGSAITRPDWITARFVAGLNNL